MQYKVTPNELTLAISIPITREEFEEHLARADHYDYIASVARRYPGLSRDGIWNLLGPTVRVSNYVAREARALGALVITGFRSSQLQEVLVGKRVVTIVAHWRGMSFNTPDLLEKRKTSRDIELADGLRSVDEFISEIPQDFIGVLDLTVCHSVVLGNAIKRERPEITIAMNRHAASARTRLVLYLAILRELKRKPQLFGDAVVNVRNIFR